MVIIEHGFMKKNFDIRNILKEKKKNIENDINEFNIRAGVCLALIKNYKE